MKEFRHRYGDERRANIKLDPAMRDPEARKAAKEIDTRQAAEANATANADSWALGYCPHCGQELP